MNLNKNILTKTLIFAAGAIIGSAVTWKLVKTKYERIAQEEIESVKEAFSDKEKKIEEEPVEESETKGEGNKKTVKPNWETYKKIIEEAGYNGSNVEEENEEEEDDMSGPYVISPEEFGEDYGIISLNYYTDGVVTDERGKIIANTDELLGEGFADHFGDYEYDPDTVYVRNDELGVDYEILKDWRAYSEIS